MIAPVVAGWKQASDDQAAPLVNLRCTMESYSKTDEVLALLNRRERGEASFTAGTTNQEESLGFKDFLPSPATAVLHKLQRISAQPQSAQPVPLTRTASEALKVVLGELRPEESRKLRYKDTGEGTNFAMSLSLSH